MFTYPRIAALALSTLCLAYPMASRSEAAQAGTHVAATGAPPAAAPASSSQGSEIESQPQPQPRAYLFRGALGPIFSRGMDHLAERIEQAGIPADVNEFTICRLIAESEIRRYREDPALIILIGHSMG